MPACYVSRWVAVIVDHQASLHSEQLLDVNVRENIMMHFCLQ